MKYYRQLVYQLKGTVNNDDGPAAGLRRIVDIVLPFMNKVLYQSYPEGAREYRSFKNETPKGRCQAIAIPDRNLWSLRFNYTDKDEVQWYWNIAVAEENKQLQFGMKVETANGPEPLELQKKLPLVQQLLEQGGICQYLPVSSKVWKVETQEQVNALVGLLLSPVRSLPVYVISQVNWKHWDFSTRAPDYLVHADFVAERTFGYAHVAQLTFQSAFMFTEALGKNWSVYDGGVRTYYPNLSTERDDPLWHKLSTKGSIWNWRFENLSGSNAFDYFLIDIAHKSIRFSRLNWRGIYFVPDAVILASELELAHSRHTANAPEREQLLNMKVDMLKEKLEETQLEAEQYLDEWHNCQEEVEKLKDDVERLERERHRLNQQIESLKKRTAEPQEDTAIPIPDNYDVISDWAEKYLAGRLILHPRAKRAMKKACYSNVGRLYNALLILATKYRDVKLGCCSSDEYNKALSKWDLEHNRTGSKITAGTHGDQYYVNYPPGTDNRRFLDRHLKQGTGRDLRNILRIYFFWDEEAKVVVVGSLPEHLDNATT